MTDRLKEIQSRLDAATPGPWRYDAESVNENNGAFSGPKIFAERDEGPKFIAEIGVGRNEANDGPLMAAAPSDLAYLLAENKRLREALGTCAFAIAQVRWHDSEQAWGQLMKAEELAEETLKPETV